MYTCEMKYWNDYIGHDCMIIGLKPTYVQCPITTGCFVFDPPVDICTLYNLMWY